MFLSLQARSAIASNTTVLGIAFGSIAVLIWGAYMALSRYALTSSSLEAVDLTFIRALVAGLVMYAWLFSRPYKNAAAMAQVGLKKGLVLACLVGPPFVFISVHGYAYAPLVHGGILLPAGLVLTGLVLSALLLGEPACRSKVIGAVILLVGLVVLAGPESFSGGHMALFGDLLFFISGMMWATFAVAQKSWKAPPVVATAWVSIASVTLYCPVYLMVYGFERLQNATLEQLLLQGIVQGLFTGVIAMILFGKAVKLIGAAKTSMFPALMPITTLMVGIPLTGEYLTVPQTIGTVTVLLGLFYAISKGK